MIDPIEQQAEAAWLEFDDESDERIMAVAAAFSALFKAGYRVAVEKMAAENARLREEKDQFAIMAVGLREELDAARRELKETIRDAYGVEE